ncbi:MAG: SufE family protein [Actinomycetota bacterium]
MSDALPPRLDEIVRDFADAPRDLRLEVLLGFAKSFPTLPEAYVDRTDLERVEECQTPLFLATELREGRVRLVFDAPAEAPTTRGFASILHAGLDGETPEAILAVPDDVGARLGLTDVVSPLRMRGFSSLLARVKRQVRELVAA